MEKGANRRSSIGDGHAAGGGSDAAAAAQPQEEPEADVPFSRLAKLNSKEWPYFVIGCIASAANGGVQPAFAFVISSMISVFYTLDKVRLGAGSWDGAHCTACAGAGMV